MIYHDNYYRSFRSSYWEISSTALIFLFIPNRINKILYLRTGCTSSSLAQFCQNLIGIRRENFCNIPIAISNSKELIPGSTACIWVCLQADHHFHLLPSFILVTLLTSFYASVQVSDIFVLTVCFKLMNSAFQIFPSLFLKVLPVSRLTLFILSPFIWLVLCIHCNLARFLLPNNF
jgi:hypothetical protein